MTRNLGLSFAVLFLAASNAFTQTAPAALVVDGYVTRVVSPTDFDVNGLHVVSSDKTHFSEQRGEVMANLQAAQPAYMGEPVKVYGALDKKTHTIAASAVLANPAARGRVSGQGIIDRVMSSQGEIANTGEVKVRADGYPILITAKTAAKFNAPMKAIADVGTNVWIAYEGTQRLDGVVVAEKAVFTRNAISVSESKVLARREYDPAAVDPTKKQGLMSKAFLGVDPKKIPPYKDDTMQARIDKIGGKLIPEYQRALSDTDATKIHFRFQLIESDRFRDAFTLDSGIILVPKQVVERMQSDAQLATVLADNIACALEKQEYRAQPAAEKLTAAQVAGGVGGFFVPGLGLATLAVNAKIGLTILRHAEEQSGRVSLGLLQDAGYDIHEAPTAWWLLAPKKPKTMLDTAMPYRSAYLYGVIGTTWRGDKMTE